MELVENGRPIPGTSDVPLEPPQKNLFVYRADDGSGCGQFRVLIWDSEECNTGRNFSLGRYDHDIARVLAAVEGDPDLADLLERHQLTRPDLKALVERVLCHQVREETRHYGIGHH